ncbi:BAG family molecular chaperone regulator 4 [Lactuca sativa]|uniref:Ubiquitin-like domain-containing protein n=1 Tax=Lactuca sativa TaxID=4236 RepID=A0A9R1WTK2_LACSA|nr:BAG family molecular chaperone regulator 4 [Lactuca sativa]KAJ0187159.1 hypothetical protein LSAT_V11C900469320 [Lactuca sativa]
MMEESGGAAAAAAPTTTTTTTGNEVEHTGASNIKVQVSYGSNNFDVFVLPQSTFGDLKMEIAKATGLEPEAQNLLFRGKEKDENERLDMAGVKDNAKVILTENSPTIDKDKDKDEEEEENVEKVEEEVKEISKGVEAVSLVRKENDEFAEQVGSLEAVVCSGTQVSDKDFLFLTEMLMRQLLKLDGIDAQGEGRIQRKLEVRRVQGLVETLDDLKVKNSNPNPNPNPNPISNVPEASATKATQEWEVFE